MMNVTKRVPGTQDTAGEPLAAVLRKRGLRTTPQRILIEDALHSIGRHATADEVRAAVAERLPNCTTPTVYATLELLVELGRARKVQVGHGPARFDPRTDNHAHFLCTECGAIEDVPLPDSDRPAALALAAASSAGHEPHSAELVIEGRCARCRRERRRSAKRQATASRRRRRPLR